MPLHPLAPLPTVFVVLWVAALAVGVLCVWMTDRKG